MDQKYQLNEINVQCQKCGYVVVQDVYALPTGWSQASDGNWYCDDCSNHYRYELGIPQEERPLLGSEYNSEFDPSYW